MRKLFGVLVVLVALSTSVCATDLMVVMLEDGDWENTKRDSKKWIPVGGDRSMHKVPVAHEDCTNLLDRLKKAPVILTLRNPTSKGRVIEAFCILPSGSVMKWPASAGE